MSRALILLLGESFRLGGQGTRNRGHSDSVPAQIEACKTHLRLFESLPVLKDIYVGTYTTPYDQLLVQAYGRYLIGADFHESVMGLSGLFHSALHTVGSLEAYRFIFYLRIDLFVKPLFDSIFDCNWPLICFPSICFKINGCDRCGNHPRVNDMMLFVPKRYFLHLLDVRIGHDMWYDWVTTGRLGYDDLGTMVSTYHDSDSSKDFNPFYYIVNRPESTTWHCALDTFNKEQYGK
jgi:hypothetical protein